MSLIVRVREIYYKGASGQNKQIMFVKSVKVAFLGQIVREIQVFKVCHDKTYTEGFSTKHTTYNIYHTQDQYLYT